MYVFDCPESCLKQRLRMRFLKQKKSSDLIMTINSLTNPSTQQSILSRSTAKQRMRKFTHIDRQQAFHGSTTKKKSLPPSNTNRASIEQNTIKKTINELLTRSYNEAKQHIAFEA